MLLKKLLIQSPLMESLIGHLGQAYYFRAQPTPWTQMQRHDLQQAASVSTVPVDGHSAGLRLVFSLHTMAKISGLGSSLKSCILDYKNVEKSYILFQKLIFAKWILHCLLP